jgi:hypothetical protein
MSKVKTKKDIERKPIKFEANEKFVYTTFRRRAISAGYDESELDALFNRLLSSGAVKIAIWADEHMGQNVHIYQYCEKQP